MDKSTTNAMAWSYSRLDTFETCPRKYELINYRKQVTEPPNEAARYGLNLHTELANYAETGGITANIERYTKYVDRIKAMPGELIVEFQMALTSNFSHIDWFHPNVWVRGIIDIGVLGDTQAAVFDWKTGKRNQSDQMELMALLTLERFPRIETVKAGFIWLKSGEIDIQEYHRTPDMWNTWMERVATFQRAHEEDNFPAKQNGLCKNWCPVSQALCPHGR